MNTEQFTHVPYCVIKNNTIINYNKEFAIDFNYPKDSVAFLPFDIKSEQNINGKPYIIYNVGDEEEKTYLFFNKENIPNLKYNTNLKTNLSHINFGDEYLCYNTNIDNAHIDLCKTINKIIDEYINNEKMDDAVFNLLYLLSSTKDHFSFEESLMDEFLVDFSDHK